MCGSDNREEFYQYYFPDFHEWSLVKHENILVFRKYTLNNEREKEHDVYTSLNLKRFRKNAHTHRLVKQMW